MFEVKLNAVEQAISVIMGMARRVTAEVVGRRNKQVSGRNNFDVHWMGAKAEVAFGKFYNLCPDFGYHTGRPDFELNGEAIDVKATDYDNGNLICLESEGASAVSSIYVLAVVRDDVVELVGYARREELFDPGNVRSMYAGGPRSHFVKRGDLHSMPERRREHSMMEGAWR